MVRDLVPFQGLLHQPLLRIAPRITVLLSFGMTLTAALQRWPQSPWLAVGTAIACETSKVALFVSGLRAWRGADTWSALLYAVISTVMSVVVFGTISIAASVLCISQSETTTQREALASSRQYNSALAELRAIETKIDALTATMQQDLANGYRTRGLQIGKDLSGLEASRQAATEKVAVLEQGTPARTTTLPWGGAGQGALLELIIEVFIATAIEIASFVYLCDSPARALSPPPSSTRGRYREAPEPLPEIDIAAPLPRARPPSAVARQPMAAPATETTTPPATYARRFRYDFGPRTESLLAALSGNRRERACCDLLHRMGLYCLRVSGTDGVIPAHAVLKDLRGGRDERTVQTYLDLLVDVGALAFDGQMYTIAHFLDANPPAAKRAQFVDKNRAGACERQQKHRKFPQKLQQFTAQNVDLSGSSADRHAINPLPTTHAAPAAHAATHQPTPVQQPSLVDVGPALRPTGPRRNHGVVRSDSLQDGEDSADWLRRTARVAAGDLSALRIVSAEETNGATDKSEEALLDAIATESIPSSPRTAPTAAPCVPVNLSTDPTPVNQHDVAKACEKIGFPAAGHQMEELFRTLSRETVREVELRYAAWCTAKRRAKGALKFPEHAATYMLAIIHRQRAMAVGGA